MSAAAAPDVKPSSNRATLPPVKSISAGGLKIMGSAKEPAAAQGADAPPSKGKAAGAGGSKGAASPARKKQPPKGFRGPMTETGDQPSTSTKSGPSKTEATRGKVKQALKNTEAGITPKPAPQHIEPLQTNNRSKLPSFNLRSRPPVPMYSSPYLPHSYSTAADPRSTAPAPSELNSALHCALLESWVASRPRPETLEARKQALDRVARAVASFNGSYQLALFGSVANGVDNDASDLDICVIDDSRPGGYDPSLDEARNRRGIFNMYLLGDKLGMQGMVDIVPIPMSNTPIVKCRDPRSGIELDLNVNDLGGVYNTNLIESYCYLSPYALRPLLNLVKKWGKARSIASQSTGAPTFSSYCFNLLCIAYMQNTAPVNSTDGLPYLPNLQAPELIAKYNVRPSSIDIRINKKHKVGTPTNTTFVPVYQHLHGGADNGAWGMDADRIAFWQARNENVDIGDLAAGFFRYYAGVDGRGWDWASDGVSILHGGRFSRDSDATRYEMSKLGIQRADGIATPSTKLLESTEGRKLLNSWSDQLIVIQDPFIVSKNCARPIGRPTAEEIMDEFERAAELLEPDDATSFDLLCEVYNGGSLRKQLRRQQTGKPREGKRTKTVRTLGGPKKTSPPPPPPRA